MVVQHRVEGCVQDVGVDVRSDKVMARTDCEDNCLKTHALRLHSCSALSLEPHTCKKRSRVRAVKCSEVPTLYTCAYNMLWPLKPTLILSMEVTGFAQLLGVYAKQHSTCSGLSHLASTPLISGRLRRSSR